MSRGALLLALSVLLGCGPSPVSSPPAAMDGGSGRGGSGGRGGGGSGGGGAGGGGQGGGGAVAGGTGGGGGAPDARALDSGTGAEGPLDPQDGGQSVETAEPGPVVPTEIPNRYPTGPGPSKVEPGPGGRLVYSPEPNGDTIPDFSYAGYRGGGVPIPDVPVVTTLSPMAGERDASGRLQAAIDQLAARPVGADGYRGALLLTRGTYPLARGLVINASGIVVRGEGDGADGTDLQIVSDGGQAVKIFTISDGGKAPAEVAGSRRRLTDPYVPVGARWFRVESAEGYAAGDTVMVVRPSTAEWISAIGMAAYGWAAGGYDMKFDRTVLAVQGNKILVDAPLVQAIDQKYGGGYVYRYRFPDRLQRVGIERLRGSSTLPHPDGLNTRGNFIHVEGLSDGFFRRLTNWYLQGSPMRILGARSLTIEDMVSIHKPWPGAHSGASPSVFTFDGSQLLLFQRLTSSDGGFEFSSGARSPGPNVYTDSKVPHGYAFSGPHHRWANATLYDKLELAHGLHVRNAKDQGSGHGWQGANHVFWNCKAPSFICERPPTTHQWHVGGSGGSRSGDCEWHSWDAPVKPDSLYRAQMADRLGEAGLAAITARP